MRIGFRTRRGVLTSALAVAVSALLVLGGTTMAAGPFVEPEAVALVTLQGEAVGDTFGWVAANLGDINGDGLNEFITTAPGFAVGGRRAGKAYIYAGDGSLLHTITGNPGDRFGYSATSAGDVNGDGIPDYIIGGPGGPRAAPPFRGRATVYSGANHTVIHEMVAPLGNAFGSAVSGAGDVNGDGYADLIVGAEQAGYNGENSGRVYLFSGKDGSLLWTRDGEKANDFLGTGVGLVGDVNGDGIPEVVVAAHGGGRKGAGAAYLLSGLDGRLIYTFEAKSPPQPAGQGSYGQFFAMGAGDIDGDGIPDIYIGDYNAIADGVVGTGRVYIYSGCTGKLIRRFDGEPGAGLGPGRGIGDITGDGFGDLVIASYTSNAGAPGGGQVAIYSGHNRKLLRTITGNIEGDNLGGDALSIGDVTGDGLTDYILTAYTGLNTPGTLYIVPGIRQK